MSENNAEIEEQQGEELEQVCRCPDHWPNWDGTDQALAGQYVHRMPIASLFHMPLAYDQYVGKQADNIVQLGLTEKWPGLVFTRTGVWGGEILRLIEDAESASRFVQVLSPPFDVNVMVHHGGIGTIQKTLRKQQAYLTDVGRVPKELYLAHLSCPVCETQKGGEMIMVIRRWEASKRLQDKIQARNR